MGEPEHETGWQFGLILAEIMTNQAMAGRRIRAEGLTTREQIARAVWHFLRPQPPFYDERKFIALINLNHSHMQTGLHMISWVYNWCSS